MINKNKRKIIFGAIVLILVFFTSRVFMGVSNKNNKETIKSESEDGTRTAYVDINKSFEFKAIDASKKDVPVTFTIVSAERKSDIKVKGENRVPVSGKDYLLLRVEIQNSKTERVAIASADRVRLDIDGKMFAPDYHNGNVVIDPISTKKDILAFAVDAKQKTFVFQIGELEGEKQKVEVNF